jgi:hypothetical protein
LSPHIIATDYHLIDGVLERDEVLERVCCSVKMGCRK